jgi:hypothetical protein
MKKKLTAKSLLASGLVGSMPDYQPEPDYKAERDALAACLREILGDRESLLTVIVRTKARTLLAGLEKEKI